jgi:glutamyl-tRNA reductase
LVLRVLGTNHKGASLDDREQMAASAGTDDGFLGRAGAALGARECVALRTCNRIEIYYLASTTRQDEHSVEELFRDACGLSAPTSTDSVYCYSGEEAASHLFAVACGLDSMVLGEHEILGQVRSALGQAVRLGHAGPGLTDLFNHAVRVGRRARRETAISSGIFSVGQCAVRLARQALGDLKGSRLLVVGAGQIARVVAKHMAAMGLQCVTIFSRTTERAQELAATLGGRAITADELPQALLMSDIVVGCAAVPHHCIGAAQIRRATQERGGRPLVVVDMGVPRNVEPEVGQLAGVHLFDLDDLSAVVAENRDAREAEILRVKSIIAEEVIAYQDRETQAEARAVIAKLREKAEQLRQECLIHARRRQLPEDHLACFDYISDLLVRKLLHAPSRALREASCGDDSELLSAVRRLFDIEVEDTLPGGEENEDVTDAGRTGV